jgi:hypothetical protein
MVGASFECSKWKVPVAEVLEGEAASGLVELISQVSDKRSMRTTMR